MLLHLFHLTLVLFLDQCNLTLLDLDILHRLLHLSQLFYSLSTVVLHQENILTKLNVLCQISYSEHDTEYGIQAISINEVHQIFLKVADILQIFKRIFQFELMIITTGTTNGKCMLFGKVILPFLLNCSLVLKKKFNYIYHVLANTAK